MHNELWFALTIFMGAFVWYFTLSHASWGPGIHIHLARDLVQNPPARLSRRQVRILKEHRDSFYYGCIAADIISFKKYGGLKNHCHNWNMKERIEAVSESDADAAFLYGYLCHLAADVIAHNHFVPYQVLYDLPPFVLGHMYWEARADSVVDEECWHIIDDLRTHKTLTRNDHKIHLAVPSKALSLRSNKFIFNHILLARSKRSWRKVMLQMRRRNPAGVIEPDFLARCLAACKKNMIHTFTEKQLTELRAFDPSGHQSLRAARQWRRTLVAGHRDRTSARAAARAAAQRCYGLH
ncbi:MAG: zinc dependent phospholipase C family protein [Planctomycetota bacterium]